MADLKNDLPSSSSTTTDLTTKFHECKYCKERFYPLIVHDLHILSKHTTEWAKPPCFTETGIFSLATNDLLKIVHREFNSLSSVTLKDIRSSTDLSNHKWTSSSDTNFNGHHMEKLTDLKTREKRKLIDYSDLDADGEQEERRKLSIEQMSTSKRPRYSSISTQGSKASDLSESRPTSANSGGERNEEPPAPKSSWGEPRNMLTTMTYVAKSIHISRQNRLALVGKPYYLQNHRDHHHHPYRSGDQQQRTSEPTIHAFRCFPKIFHATNSQKDQSSVYVFQASDANDLLRNLTWKTTKAARHRKQIADGTEDGEVSIEDKNYGEARFSGRRRAYTPSSRQDYYDRRDDLYPDNYRDRYYDQRCRRGRLFDAQFERFQLSNEACVEIKNALHLLFLQSPAGERALSTNEKEIIFGRNVRPSDQGQWILSGNARR